MLQYLPFSPLDQISGELSPHNMVTYCELPLLPFMLYITKLFTQIITINDTADNKDLSYTKEILLIKYLTFLPSQLFMPPLTTKAKKAFWIPKALKHHSTLLVNYSFLPIVCHQKYYNKTPFHKFWYSDFKWNLLCMILFY